jgi:predicted DsbA family dithiol-disulfide isomerase
MRMRGFAPETLDQWSRQGAKVGINFNWDGGRTGNSRDSHKLLRLALEPRPTAYRSSSFTQAFEHRRRQSASSSSSAGQIGPVRGSEVQMRLLEALFRESFENNYDISDRAWLQWLGTSLTNIPPAEIQACLESEEWDRAIDRLSDRNRQEFSAVPVFILQGCFVAGGWQRPELFLDVFECIRAGASGTSGGVFSAPGGPWWQQQRPPQYGGAGPDPSSST